MNRDWCRLFALAWLTVIISLGIYNARQLVDAGKIQFDLLALLPQGKTENMRLSKELMDDGNISGRLVIAFGHEDREQSKQALLKFREKLKASSLPIREHDVKQIEGDYKTLFTGLYQYRAGLIAKDDRQSLLDGREEMLVERAIANILSPFGSFNAAQIKTDPFGFYPRYVTSFHSHDSPQTDPDGNITVQSEGKTWSIYQGEVTEKIFSLKLQEKISESLLPILTEIEKEYSVEALRLGGAFYASAGAQLAQNEISKISLISTLGIILILLLIFRAPHPILLALAVIFSGLLAGLAACLLVFESIHILALVFGCSLVGVAVDYALHYYCASFKPVDRFRILSLLPAMPLGVLTSSIGYGALIVAPFPGIQQMAVLACVGLLCTFISVSVWGPYFIKAGDRKTPPLAEKCQHHLEHLAKLGSLKYLKPAMAAMLLSVFCAGGWMIAFDDNVRNFQSMDPQLKNQEERIKAMIKFDHSTKFLAVTGHEMEAILQIEETIAKKLDIIGVSYRALSDLIPSQKRQRENAILKLQFSQAHFPEIARTLEMDQSFNPAESGFDGKALIADAPFLSKLPTGWKELVHVAEDGLMTGRMMVNREVEDLPGAAYVDPVQEYSSLFASYREVMMILVTGLLLGFALIIGVRQGLRATIVITSPVLLSMLATVGIIGLSGIGFSMFHAMGLILVLCIGIDYALFLYWHESGKKELLLLGNALAAITTILSFGLLALSTTTAVHSFGMTVFLGIVLNFFITTLYLGSSKCIKS